MVVVFPFWKTLEGKGFKASFLKIKEKKISLMRIDVEWTFKFSTERDSIIFIYKGKGKIKVDKNVFKVKEGDVLLMRKGEKVKVVGKISMVIFSDRCSCSSL